MNEILVVYGDSSDDIWGGAVRLCYRIWRHRKLHHRIWRHRKLHHRKWKGDNFPCFPRFPGTPLDSRYEQWNQIDYIQNTYIHPTIMHKHTNLLKIIHQNYEQAYTKNSNDNTCKIKWNNNKKSISIAIETATCLALHHISTKNARKKNKKHKLRSTICMHCTGMSCSLDPMFVLNF